MKTPDLNSLLSHFKNPDYIFQEKDVTEYAGQTDLFLDLIESVIDLIEHPRTRQHLLLYKFLTLNNSVESETRMLKSRMLTVFQSLIFLNYTFSDRELLIASSKLGIRNHDFKSYPITQSVLAYPSLLLQQFRKSKAIYPSFFKSDGEHKTRRMVPVFIPLVKESNIKGLKQYLSILPKIVSWTYLLSITRKLKTQSSNDDFVKKLMEINPDLFTPENTFHTLLKGHFNHSYPESEINARYWINFHGHAFKGFILKEIPQIEIFSFLFDDTSLELLKDNAWELYLLKTSHIGTHYKMNEFRSEKAFLKDTFGFQSSTLSSFIKRLPENYPHNPTFFIKDVLTAGLICKEWNLSHNGVWKILKTVKEGNYPIHGLIEEEKLVSYMSFLNFLSEDQKIRFFNNSINQIEKRQYMLQDFLYEDSKGFMDNEAFFLNFFNTMAFNEYNNIYKLHHLMVRELNRITSPAYSFYSPNYLALEHFPKMTQDLEVMLASGSEDLIQWGFTLRNCIGSYLKKGNEIYLPLMVGFKKEGEIVQALEICFPHTEAFFKLFKKYKYPEDRIQFLTELKNLRQLLILKKHPDDSFASLEEYRSQFNENPLIPPDDLKEILKPWIEITASRQREFLISQINQIVPKDFDPKGLSLPNLLLIDSPSTVVVSATPAFPPPTTTEELRADPAADSGASVARRFMRFTRRYFNIF